MSSPIVTLQRLAKILVHNLCQSKLKGSANLFYSRYWLDKETAIKVDQRVQKCLFLFACTNSCMNPIVYGVYNIRKKIERNNMVNYSTYSIKYYHDVPRDDKCAAL